MIKGVESDPEGHFVSNHRMMSAAGRPPSGHNIGAGHRPDFIDVRLGVRVPPSYARTQKYPRIPHQMLPTTIKSSRLTTLITRPVIHHSFSVV